MLLVKRKNLIFFTFLALALMAGGVSMLCVSAVSIGGRYGGRGHAVMGWEKNFAALSMLSIGLGIASSFIRPVNVWARGLLPIVLGIMGFVLLVASFVIGRR
jgi:hypothetical protein